MRNLALVTIGAADQLARESLEDDRLSECSRKVSWPA